MAPSQSRMISTLNDDINTYLQVGLLSVLIEDNAVARKKRFRILAPPFLGKCCQDELGLLHQDNSKQISTPVKYGKCRYLSTRLFNEKINFCCCLQELSVEGWECSSGFGVGYLERRNGVLISTYYVTMRWVNFNHTLWLLSVFWFRHDLKWKQTSFVKRAGLLWPLKSRRYF